MLTKCPECDLQVSDKAVICPHCGYPLKSEVKKQYYRSTKRKRLPNGFGQITKINNKKLRKPFRAMVTVGKTEEGRPICRLLKPEAYFETYNDAYAALVEYNKSPYDPNLDMTIGELYSVWSEKHFKELKSTSSIHNIEGTWKVCKELQDLRVVDLRSRHIKTLMDKSNSIMQSRIKSVFNLMLDYALEYEIVDKNVARSFKLPSSTIKDINVSGGKHIAFTEEELITLWNNMDYKDVDMILYNCYSGWRPSEMLEIELENINLKDWTIKGGMKTEAGIDRIVPIHPAVRQIVLLRMQHAKKLNSKYLFNNEEFDDHVYTYKRYRVTISRIVEKFGLNPEHRPHDGRKTFITLAKQYNLNEYAIKYIVGHKISDITENIYTERNPVWLTDEMEKIKSPCK